MSRQFLALEWAPDLAKHAHRIEDFTEWDSRYLKLGVELGLAARR